MKVRACKLAILILPLVAIGCFADWTHWRGPSQDGVSHEIGLIEKWSLDGLNVLWQSLIGGRATPIVLHGRVYLNCPIQEQPADHGEKKHQREQVVCWDANTGKVLWRDPFNVFQTDISAERVGWASMAGDAETGNVYVHSVSGLFRCYRADGKRLWETSLAEDFGKISGYGGRTQSPIIDEDRVIISFLAINWGESGRPPARHYYYAFDKRNGQLLWVSAPGGKPHDTNFSVPIVRVIDGRRMLIGGNADGGCYAIDARTGESIWGFRMSKRGINVSPVTDGDLVYIAHGEDNIDNLKFGRIQCIKATGQGDVTESHSVWRRDGIKSGTSSMLCHDGILYTVSDTGLLHALDSKTGADLWKYNLGSMGWGSPVLADGKIYVTEVHGNVHILKPSRTKCESLSHVYLPSAAGTSHDDIFSSPAISDGKIFLVSNDRTICLGRSDSKPRIDARAISEVNAQPTPREETKARADKVHLFPYESMVMAGESVDFRLQSYDRFGRKLRTSRPNLSLPDNSWLDVELQGHTLVTNRTERESSGKIQANFQGLVAQARIRVFPQLPWKWDFEHFENDQIPPTWIRAGKLRPTKVEDSTAMMVRPGKGRPSSYIWMGPSKMSDYTIQADMMTREQRRRLSDMGITSQRYNLILRGNTGRLEVQSWPGELRMAQGVSFSWEPNVWYTMKLRVDKEQGRGVVRGKVWNRTDREPSAWTMEVSDPYPNTNGSPGLYVYTLADCYFDNVMVSGSDSR